MTSAKKRKIFISYSWDNPEHQQWVLSLADLIESKGGITMVDRRDLKYGGHIKTFMLKSILDADIVLMILTPKYKMKADNLLGGVGYEYNIINKELFKVITTNDKYIPILRSGDIEISIPYFLQDIKYADLRDSINYSSNLNNLVNHILNIPLIQLIGDRQRESIMDIEYSKYDVLLPQLIKKTEEYFYLIFFKDGKGSLEALASGKLPIKNTFDKWEKEIKAYSEKLRKVFTPAKLETYETILEDFRTKVFRNALWTVDAALKTPDPDLARYKRDYADASPEEILSTLTRILHETDEYVKSKASKIDYKSIIKDNEFDLKYLDNVNMLMTKIIGSGIRSEILHRSYPAYFPIMTQKSLWALYFMCENSNEFITIEKRTRTGVMRVSHNWLYSYERFTFVMNEMTKELEKLFNTYGCVFDQSIRFGYANMFCSEIHKIHREDIKLLHQWVDHEV